MSHSTPEAEIVAAAFAIRREGLPSSYVWDLVLKREKGASPTPVKIKPSVSSLDEQLEIVFHEDNQTMIRVCETGRNPTMRHLGRTHFVQVAWLKERFDSPGLKLIYEKSAKQAADIYTKGFDNQQRWDAASKNIAVVDQSDGPEFKWKELNKHLNDPDDTESTACGDDSDGNQSTMSGWSEDNSAWDDRRAARTYVVRSQQAGGDLHFGAFAAQNSAQDSNSDWEVVSDTERSVTVKRSQRVDPSEKSKVSVACNLLRKRLTSLTHKLEKVKTYQQLKHVADSVNSSVVKRYCNSQEEAAPYGTGILAAEFGVQKQIPVDLGPASAGSGKKDTATPKACVIKGSCSANKLSKRKRISIKQRPIGELQRVIIEICTDEDSRIGKEMYAGDGCAVIRITQANDFTHPDTQRELQRYINSFTGRKIPVLLWVSIPCTGGTRWVSVNWLYGTDQTRTQISEHIQLAKTLFGC